MAQTEEYDKENISRKRLRKDSDRSSTQSSISCISSGNIPVLSSLSNRRIESSRLSRRIGPFRLSNLIDFTVDDPLASHTYIDVYDRAVIVNWLMETSEAFTLTCETLQLSVNYLDRCLQKMSNLDKKQTQVLATACLYVASKLEEVYPPSLDEFAEVADHLCKAHHIANQELEILLTLDWKVRITPASACLNHLCQCYDISRENRCLSELDLSKQPPEVRLPRLNFLRRVTSLTPEVKKFVSESQTTYDPSIFLKSMKVLNLAILDRHWSRYSSLTLAAAALRFITGHNLSYVPDIRQSEYVQCLNWMHPFHEIMKLIPIKPLQLLLTDKNSKLPRNHRIQRCEGTVLLLKEAHALKPQSLQRRQLLANISNQKRPDLRAVTAAKRRRLQHRQQQQQ